MSASELQDRLDYLVSYASQLIFINGETADQSSVLDTFISDSPEHIEIALLTASPTTVLAQYRESLYRQLISKTKNADFSRPLNQLLVALNQHKGSLIVSISKAENLPDKLLQELWELVLQSRFANNKQHLNILLFAQGAWAKQARNQLQSRSGDKPLLLNNLAGLPKLKQQTSELDALITLKRQQFSERLNKRAQKQTAVLPLLKRKGVIAIFVCVFLLLFAGIVSLQYPSLFTPANDLSSVLTATQQNDLETSVPALNGVEQDTTLFTQGITGQDSRPASTPSIVENNPILSDEKTSSPDPLVTSWRSAIAKIEEKPSQYRLAKPQEAVIEHQVIVTPEYNKIAVPKPAQQALIQSQSLVTATKDPELPESSALTEPQESLPSELMLQDGQYLIQISAMSDSYLLQQFMQENPLSKQVWSYTTQRFGGDWHVLLYNQSYPNLDSARAALGKLSPTIMAYEPFVKSVRQIKQELAQKGG